MFSLILLRPNSRLCLTGWVARYRERPLRKARRTYSLQVSACFLGQYTLWANWPHGSSAAPNVVDPAHGAGNEGHVPRVARAARIERTRPVVAEAACEVERTIVATARSGEEDRFIGVTRLRARHFITIYSILEGPSPSTLIKKLILLSMSRHSPTSTPISTSSVC